MKLRKLVIENFRGIRRLELDLDDTTVLIGENNSGKTAVLHALKLCLYDLGPRRRVVFDTFDFHLKDGAAEAATADPIQITITFSEDLKDEWDSQVVGRLSRQKILQVGADDRNSVVLRVTCAYNLTSRDFDQDWQFLNLAGQPLAGRNVSTTLRHLAREFSVDHLFLLSW